MRNRLYNCKNPYQGSAKRVLCVCSAGLLRSPTAAVVLSQEPFNFNTRAAGLDEGHALIPVDDVLVNWADEIVVMDTSMALSIHLKWNRPSIILDIPDNFAYRDPELMKLIVERYVQRTRLPKEPFIDQNESIFVNDSEEIEYE